MSDLEFSEVEAKLQQLVSSIEREQTADKRQDSQSLVDGVFSKKRRGHKKTLPINETELS